MENALFTDFSQLPVFNERGERIPDVTFGAGTLGNPHKVEKPRKAWVCAFCQKPIKEGEEHFKRDFYLIPGDYHTSFGIRECLPCHDLHFAPRDPKPSLLTECQTALHLHAEAVTRKCQDVFRAHGLPLSDLAELVVAENNDARILQCLEVEVLEVIRDGELLNEIETALKTPQRREIKHALRVAIESLMVYSAAADVLTHPHRDTLRPAAPPLSIIAAVQAARASFTHLYFIALREHDPRHIRFTLRQHDRRGERQEDLLQAAKAFVAAIGAKIGSHFTCEEGADDGEFVAVFA